MTETAPAPAVSAPTERWLHVRMAPVVADPGLPNELDLSPAEIRFPALLDFTESVVDEAGVRGIFALARLARRSGGQLRLRLRRGDERGRAGQCYRSLVRKGFDRGLFAPVAPLNPVPDGVVEWQLLP